MNDRLEPRMCIPLGSSITIAPGKGALLEAIGETGSITAKLADCCAGREPDEEILRPAIG